MNLPNKLTILRFLAIPFILIFLLPLPFLSDSHSWNVFVKSYGSFISLTLFSIASLTDFLDGYLARKYNIVSNFGKFLDPIVDKMLILSVWLAFVELGSVYSVIPIVIMIREFMVTGLRILAMEQGRVIAADFWGKLKTATQIVATIFLYLNYILHAEFLEKTVLAEFRNITGVSVNILVYSALIFTLISGFDYLYKNKNLLSFK